METSRPLKWVGWVWFFFLAACGTQVATPVLPPSLTTTVGPPSSAISTLAPSATPTLTPTNTPTASPTPSPTPLTCWIQGGRIEKHRLNPPEDVWPLDFRVYLPPCYDAQPQRAYPVLYLIHGQGFTDDQWDRLGVDETLDRLIPAGQLPPFLVVMPRDQGWEQPDEDGFDEAFVHTLMPWIESHYRTLPQRKYRAIGGLSRGGGWALHIGLTQWPLFGAIGGHSPAVFWHDGPHVEAWLDAIPPGQWPRIWLDVGDMDRQEILKSARWLEALLTTRGIPHEWHLYTGRHNEAYWSAHVAEYLLWYAEPWQVDVPQSSAVMP